MATHPSILAWRIPGIEEPGGLQSTGSQKLRLTLYAHTQPAAEATTQRKAKARDYREVKLNSAFVDYLTFRSIFL